MGLTTKNSKSPTPLGATRISRTTGRMDFLNNPPSEQPTVCLRDTRKLVTAPRHTSWWGMPAGFLMTVPSVSDAPVSSAEFALRVLFEQAVS